MRPGHPAYLDHRFHTGPAREFLRAVCRSDRRQLPFRTISRFCSMLFFMKFISFVSGYAQEWWIHTVTDKETEKKIPDSGKTRDLVFLCIWVSINVSFWKNRLQRHSVRRFHHLQRLGRLPVLGCCSQNRVWDGMPERVVGAGSICVEGIAYTADGLGGACYHNTVGRIKVVSCAVDVVETGLHLAVLTEKVPVAINRHSYVQGTKCRKSDQNNIWNHQWSSKWRQGSRRSPCGSSCCPGFSHDNQSTVRLCIVVFVG